MMYEQFTFKPATLSKLRCAPLAILIEDFYLWLVNLSFAQVSIYRHLLNIAYFNEYLGLSIFEPLNVVTPTQVEAFLKEYSLPCDHRKGAKKHLNYIHYSMSSFVTFLIQNEAYSPVVQRFPLYQPLLDEYLLWLRQYQNLAPSTLNAHRLAVSRFLHWLGPQATINALPKLTRLHVETFLLECTKEIGESSRRDMLAGLRAFFRFCLQKKYIVLPLDLAVPTIRTYRLATVPRSLTEEQAQTLLQSVDKLSDVGKRDHAILLLLHTYGIRGGQVSALRLEDILWDKCQIRCRAMKGGKETLLPMTEEVGNSLFCYIKEARHGSTCPEVFLTSRAPYHSLCHSSAISAIVRYKIIKQGFDLPTKGAHLFRHAFAGRMVAQGNSFKDVADMLGHRHLSTTFIYAKVDFNTLKQVAAPWPLEV